MSRDPRVEPRLGDVVRVGLDVITIRDKGIMHKEAILRHGIRGGSEYITYSISRHLGITFYQSLTGFKKRVKNAEVIHAAQD